MSNLKALNLADNNFGNGVFKKIAECSLNKLEKLKIQNVGISKCDGFKKFCNASAFKNLKKLNLYRNHMGIGLYIAF